nr:VCBS domain-containing protein [Bradyrhizobium sp. 176]
MTAPRRSTRSTVTITGTNDAPVITAQDLTGAVTEQVTPAGNLSDSGTISFSDVDLTDVHLVSATGTPIGSVLGSLTAVKDSDTTGTGTGGQLTWTYTVADSAVEYLAKDQTKVESFTITLDDGNGGLITKQIDVTITGTNDAPVLSDTTDPVAVLELSNASAQNLAPIASSFTVSDADVGDTLTPSVVGSPTVLLNGSAFTLPAGAAALTAGGAFTLTGTISNGVSANIGYTYDPTAANLDFLRAGQSLTITYVVKVNDGTVDSGMQDVTFTITGTNDAVTLSAITQPSSVAELASASAQDLAPISGTLPVSDFDVGDTFTASINGTPTLVWSGGSLSAGQISSLTAALVTGKLAFTSGVQSNGGAQTIGYTYDAAAANLDFLATGQTLTVNYAVQVSDGTVTSATQPLNFVITGTNDAPVITSAAQAGAITEIANTHGSTTADTATGAVTFTDADLSDTHTMTVTGVTTSGTTTNASGSLTSNNATLLSWLSLGALTDSTNGATGSDTWTFSAQDQSFDYLFAGQTVTLTYTVQVADTHGGTTTQNVAVTITGADEPNNTLLATVVQGHQGSSADPSTVTITFSTGVHTNFVNLSNVMHVSGLPNVTVINGSGSFTDSTHYQFSVDKGAGSNNGSQYTLTIDAGAFSDNAGNTTIAKTQSGLKPAGISGEPINLGLTDLTGHHGEVTSTITGTPSDWTLNGATHNSDGSWTVVMNDVGSLTVTTAANYTGALVLNVVETWVNADGSAGNATVVDNVEAYAQGSPIFALSGEDNLTGSSGHDMFVLSQPIGNDVVHSFQVSSDVIDLISYGWHTFSDVQAHTADDAGGNAVITLADGQTVTLDGVHAADLIAANFEFDVTPTVENAGPMTIGDGAMLPLSGNIHNAGTIELQAAGDDTLLQLIQTGITLSGGGHVTMSDDDHNIIAGTAANVTFDNVDNMISGAGQIGQGGLMLSNEGTIHATGAHALVIDTGTNVITNPGTLESTGSGGLVIESAVANSGLLWANGGTVTAQAEVTGSGTAEISGAGAMEFGAASSANVVFDANATGHLILDDAFHFTGTVSGLAASNDIDLKGIAFGADTTLSFIENQAGTGGTLTVSDGAHTANVVLLGQYDPTGFNDKADSTNGTAISYDPHHMA